MEFYRGDTFAFKFFNKYKSGECIKKEDIETLFITAKKYLFSNNILFQKNIEDLKIDSDGCCHATIEPKDTELLECGKYLFDIEITLKSGCRKTRLFEFTLLSDTTCHGGENDGI